MLSELACRRASPRDVAYKITDGHGLYLLVLPSGYRSWRWRYRFGGKEKLLTFGAYPEISRRGRVSCARTPRARYERVSIRR